MYTHCPRYLLRSQIGTQVDTFEVCFTFFPCFQSPVASKVEALVDLIYAGKNPPETRHMEKLKPGLQQAGLLIESLSKGFSSLGLYKEKAGWCVVEYRWHG